MYDPHTFMYTLCLSREKCARLTKMSAMYKGYTKSGQRQFALLTSQLWCCCWKRLNASRDP